MRLILQLLSACALVGAGCNSKPTAPPQASEETAPAAPKSKSAAAFRDRPAAAASGSNQVLTVKAKPGSASARALIPSAAGAASTTGPDGQTAEADAAEKPVEVRPEDLPEEGDEVLVPPQLLGILIPGMNFENIGRKEPINVSSLLEQRGIVITNYQQLVEMGITNYQIVRAQKPVTGDQEK